MKTKTWTLHLAKALGLFALFRTITRNNPRLLCYHGGSVGDEHEFNPKLFCRPGLLEQRLRWLKRQGFAGGNLGTLLQAKPTKPSQGIPVIVTLDDGWYSTGTDLLPVLARYGYQPVLYLATKVFASGGPVIDVCLRYILWKTPLKKCDLRGFHPEVDGNYELTQKAEGERLCEAAERWLALLDGDVSASVAALERLAEALNIPGATLNLGSRRFSFMQRDELLRVASQGCHIELHGHAHQYLRGQREQNRLDVETCRQHILATGLPAPHHYCYPSGDHDSQAPAMLKTAGVSTAVTCRPGLVRTLSGDDRYFLPRFLDGGDVSMIEFEAEMSGVLDFIRRWVRRPHRRTEPSMQLADIERYRA